ncbi:MAG: hypothetical protein ACREQ7_10745 [Candidatus Binatia bacterium]
MKARIFSFSALVALLAMIVFTAMPVRAESVDDKIKAVEEELARLKAEQEQVKNEQMALKKQATEAAAALPTFSYRAGSGILMEAADKSWSLRFLNRFHYWLLFRDGEADTRGGLGELFARRIRPTFFYCVNNCFYETEVSFDLDSTDAVSLQRAATFIHFEQINPWLPTFYFGIDSPTAWARRRSSSSGAQLDYDILSRSNGFNTGSQGWNYALLWEDKPLAGIGAIEWFTIAVGAGPGAAGDGGFVFSDRKDYVTSIAISPFSQLKNKWLRGLELSSGVWFCNFDNNVGGEKQNCDDAPIRETDGPERATIWDANVDNTGTGDGTHHFIQNGLRWRIGPYQLLANIGFQRYEGSSIRHRNWFIGHELYVWSPKGFLTGSASTPGSILLGTHFERSDGRCGNGACENDGQYNDNHMTMNSVGLYYFIQRGIRVGVHWNHYRAPNITSDVQEELSIRDVGVPGRGGSWDNVFVVFGWEF